MPGLRADKCVVKPADANEAFVANICTLLFHVMCLKKDHGSGIQYDAAEVLVAWCGA